MSDENFKRFINLPPNAKKVIAVTGKARSGKDTIGDFLEQTHLYSKFSFAYPIRQIAKIALNLSDKQVYDDAFKNRPLPNYHDITVRKALQLIGTEMFRDMIDKDIWCKNLIHRTRSCSNNLIVITDMRFPNEQDALRELYGDHCFFLKVVRDGCDGNVGVSNHESEAYDLECDRTVANHSEDKDILYGQLHDLIHEINFHD